MAAEVGMSERELFLAALDQPAGKWAAFLAEACGPDRVLRERVEALLREHEGMGEFLEMPAVRDTAVIMRKGRTGTELTALVREKPGETIDRYKLLQKIGEGGCGVVYMAEQEQPVRRRVAFKIIKLGMDTRSVIARFEVERQALAMMDHPNIAKVFDAGATQTGRPYFVMELVRGVRITEYCDQNNLSTRERLELFIQVCHAIQHAHQKGVIHRDIKPSNILVTLHDGKPVPKVIDFGIAKAVEQRLTDKTLFTEFTAFIGTPAYMSPEQAEMSGLDIDTRSDVYSLGVLLYELLTGKTPFDAAILMGATLEQCRKTIREDEPPRPSTRLAAMAQAELTTTANQRRLDAPKLITSLRGDLDWIVMKCLEKDRTRRYATVNDLATEVENYLQGEPVTARPPSTTYRLRKLFRRHQGAFMATSAIAATLLLGAGLSFWQAIRATRAEHRAVAAQSQETRLRVQAEQGKAAASLNEYVADINLGHQAVKDGNLRRALQLLEKHRPKAGETDLRGFEWYYLAQLCQGDPRSELPAQEGPVHAVALSPDGTWAAVGLREKVNIYAVQTKTLIRSLPKGGLSLAFLPDGKWLVAASPLTLRVWDTTLWTNLTLSTESPAWGPGPGFDRWREKAMALSRDGTRLAGVTREGVRVWSTADWQVTREIERAAGPLAFSPDGALLAAETREGLVIWRGENKLLLPNSTNTFAWFRTIAFSPDGKYLVAPQNTLTEKGVFIINIWDAATGAITCLPNDPDHIEHTGSISALAFSPDGRTLVSASSDHSIRLWDFAKRERTATLQGHRNEVWALAFSRDGERIISGGKDGSIHIWSARPQNREESIAGSWSPISFSKDGRRFAAWNREGVVGFFNVATQEPEEEYPMGAGRFQPRFALSADMKVLAQGSTDGHVRIWNTERNEAATFKLGDGRIDAHAISPDGSVLITSGDRRSRARWWELRDEPREREVNLDSFRLHFSSDGRTLAEVRRDDIQLWDVPSASVRTNLVLETGVGFAGLAFCPDGHLLATAAGFGDTDYAIQIRDTLTGELTAVVTGHKQQISSIAFSPDHKTLVSSSDDSTLRFWNLATQQELLTIRRLGGPVRNLIFSPDGQLLIGRGVDGLCFYRAPR